VTSLIEALSIVGFLMYWWMTEQRQTHAHALSRLIKSPSLGHHTPVEHLIRVLRYPDHELGHLPRSLSWHATSSRDLACPSIYSITSPEDACSPS
jgi:hypothetical protein